MQCRMQGALFALRERTPMPPNLCGHLAPPPAILGPQSPLAYVRFTPPEEDEMEEEEEEMQRERDFEEPEEDYFNEEIDYYPPVKKSMDDR